MAAPLLVLGKSIAFGTHHSPGLDDHLVADLAAVADGHIGVDDRSVTDCRPLLYHRARHNGRFSSNPDVLAEDHMRAYPAAFSDLARGVNHGRGMDLRPLGVEHVAIHIALPNQGVGQLGAGQQLGITRPSLIDPLQEVANDEPEEGQWCEGAFEEAYMTHTSTSPNYQILASLDVGRRQVELEGYEFVVTASVGVSLFPAHGNTVELLLKNAESARDEAKRTGAVDMADDQVESLFAAQYKTVNSPVHRAVWDSKVPSELFQCEAPEMSPAVSEVVARAERIERLEAMLNQMDPIDREILALRHFEQLTNAEAAAELGLQASAASKRYQRALKRLGEAMNSLADSTERAHR